MAMVTIGKRQEKPKARRFLMFFCAAVRNGKVIDTVFSRSMQMIHDFHSRYTDTECEERTIELKHIL